MTKVELNVKGMSCNHCVMSVKGALKELSGVDQVDVDLESGHVTINFEGDDSRIPEFKLAIEGQGYDVEQN